MDPAPKVYQAIVAVMADLSHAGITKARKNTQQGYNFRGVDDVYNALSGFLAKHHLAILPRVLSRTCEERASKSGGALFYVVVDMEFVLVCSDDGSCHVVRFVGEAMDSADKATNKAMSAAYKYAAFQTFCIPTEGDNDADASTPDPAPKPTKAEPDASKHHASWAKEGKSFCTSVTNLGLKYTDVADWCVAVGRDRPSAMDPETRGNLLAYLLKPVGKAAVVAFATAVPSK
jgi:hypothetical protein